jgi:rubrerythrin
LEKKVKLSRLFSRNYSRIANIKLEVNNVENKKEKYECAHCGHTADGRFHGDICPECNQIYWKCGECGFPSFDTHDAYIYPSPD